MFVYKERFVAHQFDFEGEPHYLRYTKRYWWSRWKLDMNGNIPAIYRKKNGRMVEVL